MTSIQISIILSTGSLILGVSAWLLAIFAVTTSKTITSHRNTILSFSFCTLALVLQLLEINNRVNIGDYAAIEDTIRAVLIAAIVLTSITVALNIAALVKAKKKK